MLFPKPPGAFSGRNQNFFRHFCLSTAALLFLEALLLFTAPQVCLANPLKIKVMTYNIRNGLDDTGGKRLDEVIKIINLENPDIVGLQEINFKDLKTISARTGLWSKAGVPSYGRKNKGLGVFSRWPFKVETISIAGSKDKRNAAKASFNLNGQGLSFYCVHLSREGIVKKDPLGALGLEMGNQSPRLAQARSLVKTLSADNVPNKIMAGDFNTFTNSRPYAIIRDKMTEAFSHNESVSGTYRGGFFFEPKIDHIFYDGYLQAARSYVLKKGVSDHYPVVAIFELEVDQGKNDRIRAVKSSGDIPALAD